jgi:hypothetical protein
VPGRRLFVLAKGSFGAPPGNAECWRIPAQTKRTTGTADGPRSAEAFFTFTLPVSCGQTGGCRRVDARFALAVWTLTFGPFAVETSVPSDACHPWHWSLSALVTVGAGRCEKPLDQPSNPTLGKRAGSSMKGLFRHRANGRAIDGPASRRTGKPQRIAVDS